MTKKTLENPLDKLADEIIERIAGKPYVKERPSLDVNQIYVLVSEGDDGKEGIIGMFPFFCFAEKKSADMALELLRDNLSKQAKENKVKIKLVRFYMKETIEVIE